MKSKTMTPQYGRLKNFFIDHDLDKLLSEVAAKENCSISALIRQCCREALEARQHNSDSSKN